jgi:hypothetical protein
MKNPTQFERLKDATEKHLVNKRYAYRAGKAKMVMEDKKWKPEKDVKGNIIYTDDFHPETADKTILLSLAFNMAFKNYSKIRSTEEVKLLHDFKDVSEMLIRFFSNKYINIIDGSPQSTLVDDKHDYKFQAIDEFRQIEYTLFGTVERFRNYYSHYVHEPGILSFTDLFENETKTLTQNDFDDAKAWFQQRFDDAREHLFQSMTDRKKKIEEELKKPIDQNISHKEKEEIHKQYNKNIKEIDSVLGMLKNLNLLDDNKNVTTDGQLFIATMFLFKRQAKVILDKWRGLKEVEGYQNTMHTFFTYYCMKESYSLANYDDKLLKFRNIASKLSTLPYSNNPQLRSIYEKIIAHNENLYYELNKLPKGIKTSIRQLTHTLETGLDNNENGNKIREKLNYFNRKQILKDKLNAQIIPVRKRNIYTKVLLQYIH